MQIFNRNLLLQRINNNFANNLNLKVITYLYKQALENLQDYPNNFNNAIKIGYNYLDISTLPENNKIINLTQTANHNKLLQHSQAKHKLLVNEDALETAIEQNILQSNFYNLAISLFNLSLVNNLQNAINNMYNLLTNNGVILIALPTTGTLQNILQTFMQTDLQIYNGFSSKIHPFTSIDIIGSTLQKAKFKSIVATSHSLQLNYNNITDLFNHLKSFNYGNILVNKHNALLTKNYYNALTNNLNNIKNSNNQYSITLKYCIASAFKN